MFMRTRPFIIKLMGPNFLRVTYSNLVQNNYFNHTPSRKVASFDEVITKGKML